MNIFSINKKGLKFMLSLAFIVVVYIVYCYISSIGIYKVVKYSFLTDKEYNSYVARYMTKEIFKTFNYHGQFVEKTNPKTKYLKLYMLFGVNNFFSRGKIWMYYSYEVRDKNNKIITGTWRVPLVLHLKRNGWYWMIVQKDEEP